MTYLARRSMMIAAVLCPTALARPAPAGLILSVEAPKVQASTASGVKTETFDGFQAGTFGLMSTNVGTLTSPGITVVAANQYGGAGGTGNYAAIGAESGQTTATLALKGAESYFGFWWSAADSLNSMQFYSNGTLVATFSPASALSSLGSSYLGNPNTGADASEKFAYLDFNATNGTTFDKIVFNNTNTSTGFEMDNFSVSPTAFAPTGTAIAGLSSSAAVPEPSSIALTLLGGAIGLGAARARRRKASASVPVAA